MWYKNGEFIIYFPKINDLGDCVILTVKLFVYTIVIRGVHGVVQCGFGPF